MKQLGKDLDKHAAGTITLVAEDAEDIWHAYNLIAVGDLVRASTVRNVQNESETGTSTSARVRITLTIGVEATDYDTGASILHLKGRNKEQNTHVKLGAYHTLDLELHKKFTIAKSEWDSVALERIRAACDPELNTDLAAVVMQDGLAHICMIKPYMTLVSCKVEVPIPRKRRGHTTQHDRSMQRFYEHVLAGIQRHIRFDVVKCVLLASPGFVKDQFYAYMCEQIVSQPALKILGDNKGKFVLANSASGFVHAIPELLQNPAVLDKVSGTMAAGEVRALQRFYETLQTDSARAFYGPAHVLKAAAEEAIATLLISDILFRSPDISIRKQYVHLVESVRKSRGDVKIFSSMHSSGDQLAQLTGVAAILRFPMEELENDDQEDDSDSDDEIIDVAKK